jgi:hypothetical protein
MSKFLSIIEEYVDQKDSKSETTATAVISAIQSKPENKLSSQEKRVKSAYLSKLNKVASELQNEEDEDEVAQDPDSTPVEPQADTLSPEGEVFYVDLIKKALFVDLDNIELSPSEKDTVTHDVTPENAKEVANVLQKIINDFGLGV